MNIFIVDASVDKNFIYIRQWMKVVKYPLECLVKIGDFKKGITIIDIKTNVSTTRTYLIINDFNISFFTDDIKDVSDFLIKLKTEHFMNLKKEEGNELRES